MNHQHFSSTDLHFYALTSFTIFILPNIKAWGTSYSHLLCKQHTFFVFTVPAYACRPSHGLVYIKVIKKVAEFAMQRPCQNPKISRSKYRGKKGNPTYRPAKTNPKHTGLEEEALYIKTATAQIEATHNNLNRDQC